MAVLVLDLDLTLFITEGDEPRIDFDSHIIDSNWIEAKAVMDGEAFPYNIAFLNPVKLADLLEYACEHDHKFMILTAGFWDKDSILSIMENHLNLSEAAREKVHACDFLTPGNTVDQFEDQTCLDIQQMLKNERLKQFVALHPEFSDEHFVVIDDSLGHIDSFRFNQKVHAVHASTDKNFIASKKQFEPHFDPTSFYEVAKQILDRLSSPAVEPIPPLRARSFAFFAPMSDKSFNNIGSASFYPSP